MKIAPSILWAFFALLLAAFSFYGCGNLEKEVNLELPEYQTRSVVECYLEPGQPFRLLLTRSEPYFSPFPDSSNLAEWAEQLLVDSASVVISHNGTDYVLKNEIDLGYFLNFSKIINYTSPELVPLDFDHDFTLKITTREGETITSTTRLLPVVPIDSVVVEVNEEIDTIFRVLTYLTDPPDEDNYYRRMLNHHSLDSIPDQDFTTFDDYVDDGVIIFGTGYDFEEGDSVFTTIAHIERAYFDFWESTFNSINSNGNPFGHPASILPKVTGGGNPLGIFTGLSFVRRLVFIEK